ncbi:MAG TPA: nucleotidyltransferase family protein [Bryobacteraceae bacterium]|nr:nucleotidyltransferase family protein [Bryobacteraceae bacterium]
MPTSGIAGIILAAGASRRMGRPKALLDYRGETFLARLVRIFGTVCDPVIVALGHHARDGAEALLPHVPSGARVVVNPDPDRGQLSSLQIALAALPPEASGFLFTLVDCPAVSEATVAAVKQAFEQRPASCQVVIPRYGGRRGHPVCAAPALVQEFLALPPTAETRQVINARADRILYLDVDDPGVLADADDPAAYARLTGKHLEPVR